VVMGVGLPGGPREHPVGHCRGGGFGPGGGGGGFPGGAAGGTRGFTGGAPGGAAVGGFTGGPPTGGFPGGGFPGGGTGTGSAAGGTGSRTITLPNGRTITVPKGTTLPGAGGFGGVGRGAGPGGAGAGGAAGGLLNASTPGKQLTALLTANASRYTWVAATTGANTAAGYQLAADEPIMAIGGFNGTDPSPTLAQFQSSVAQGKIHYYLAGGGFGPGGGSSTTSSSSAIATWVKAHYTAKTVDGVTVYDLTVPSH